VSIPEPKFAPVRQNNALKHLVSEGIRIIDQLLHVSFLWQRPMTGIQPYYRREN
jgi:hypothetical protein